MKRQKRLYILLGVLAAGCVATFAATKITEHQEAIKTSEDVILSVSAEEVTALSWNYDDTALAFTRDEDGTWHWDDDDAFPVSDDQMTTLLNLFQEFSVSFTIEDVEDYSPYGLDDPVGTIEVTTESETYTVTLGDFSKLDEQRYVSIGDGNAYLVSTDPMDTYEVTIEDMIAHDDGLFYTSVSSIQIEGSENLQIEYSEEENRSICADDRYYVGDLSLDTSKITSYLTDVEYLDLSTYVTYNATDEELAAYGLDDPELTITVNYTNEDEEEDTFVLHISRSAEDKTADNTANVQAESEDEDSTSVAYARVGDSQIIYEITGAEFENLMAASYDDLRHEEVFTADFSTVTAIEVTLEGETYILTAPENADDDDASWLLGEEEIDITDIESALEDLSADDFTDEEATGQEELSLTITMDNESFPAMTIVLYRVDGSNCLATVDGESFALIPRSQVVELVEAVNAIVLN